MSNSKKTIYLSFLKYVARPLYFAIVKPTRLVWLLLCCLGKTIEYLFNTISGAIFLTIIIVSLWTILLKTNFLTTIDGSKNLIDSWLFFPLLIILLVSSAGCVWAVFRSIGKILWREWEDISDKEPAFITNFFSFSEKIVTDIKNLNEEIKEHKEEKAEIKKKKKAEEKERKNTIKSRAEIIDIRKN